MWRTGVRRTRIGRAALAAAAALAVAGPLAAAPPGTLPYGAYDPQGDYKNDRDVVIEHIFLPWEDVYLPSLVDADSYALQRKRALLVTLEPWTWTRSERNTPKSLREGIRSGAYDKNISAVCGVLAGLKSPVTLRWAHEMENSDGQFIWSGWPPAEYVSAFRHMTTLCRQIAPNIRVMWSPAGEEGLEAYYPGAAFVDVVGLSVFGLQAQDQAEFGKNRTFAEVLAPRYARAVKFGKPVVIAEVGVSGDAAYVQSWNDSFRQVGPQFPDLVGVVYFDQKEVYPWYGSYGTPDWRLEHRVTGR